MSDFSNLIASLEKIDCISDDEWMSSLSARKMDELEFHNRDRDPEFREKAAESSDTYEKFYGNKKFYACTAASKAYVDQWIVENSNGSVFLDYACGNGANALTAARAGAKLALGLDISDVSVQNCRNEAAQLGVDGNSYFVQADAEDTKLPDACVDSIICSGMLHHLDLSYAIPELRRILKPGGRILAVEALDYNPVIKLYRKLTPDMRTEWEKAHILSLKDVEFASRFFEIGEVRYWHVVGYAGAFLPNLQRGFDSLDSILTKIPLIQRLAWMFTFELVKPD